MSAPLEGSWQHRFPHTRHERHFGDRVLRCFPQRPRNAFDLLGEAAARHPEGEAIVAGGERLSYRAFAELAARCCQALADAGVGQGDRVALLLGNGAAFPVVMFAALRLGAIAVPLSIREQADGLAYMLNQCGAKLLVHDADLASRLPQPEATPHLDRRIALEPGQHAARMSLLAPACAMPPAAVQEEDTAIILYTSGTTGRPKGAMLSHLGIVHSALHFEYGMRLTAQDRTIVAVPMSHVTGVIALIAAMVRAGAALVVMPTFKSRDFLDLAEAERMTHALMVPAMYNLCLLDPGFDARKLSAWRVGGYGGAPMAPATIARFAEVLPGLELINAYGATETTSPVTMMPPWETATHADSVGLPLPCADILVMDDEGLEVPAGQEGELWLGGPMVVQGYWDNEPATRDGFVGGYWRSGDIGCIDTNGFVRVFDRKKDMINRGGYKIFSVEVENVLMAVPGVQEAAVVARPCPVLGERVHAFVVAADAGVSDALLRAHCASRLADYKVPETFTLRQEPLPRNANGKLLKRNLRADAS